MRTCLLAVLMLSSVACCADDRPMSLVANGGFERPGGWSATAGATPVAADRGGKCMKLSGPGSLTQDIPVTGADRVFSCTVDIKTSDIAGASPAGYAYAAVYQLNSAGDWVAYRDFAQLKGTNPWQRYNFTFELAPTAEVISLRCGIFNAGGTAWFDNWTLVAGKQPRSFVDVLQPGVRGAQAARQVAVFRQPDLPVLGAASSPERLGKLLSAAGFQVAYLSAEDLASSARLNASLYALLVLPYGESFPAAARQNVTNYLHQGGNFISTGGYAFENLLLQDKGTWRPEKQVLEERLAAALDKSLLADGGFESSEGAPLGGMEADARWHRSDSGCTIVRDRPLEGTHCARVQVSDGKPAEARWYLYLKPQTGAFYRVAGNVRTERVEPVGTGFAYMALYQWSGDKLIKHRDYAQVTGTHDWQRYCFDFVPEPGVDRLEMKMGLWQANGTAWFDDMRLANISGMAPRPMNTSSGTPGDGLGLLPTQIGVFDAGFPLRRVARLVAPTEQHLFPATATAPANLTGWAAAGVQGSDHARWVPLLSGRDRLGRDRGAVGALMLNTGGFYSGSLWGYFGAENCDLFDGKSPALDQGLVNLAQFIVRGVYLSHLKTDLAMYHNGEPVQQTVTVHNSGAEALTGKVTFRALPQGDAARAIVCGEQAVSVPAGETQTAQCTWQPGRFGADLYQLFATLSVAQKPVDEMLTGFVVQREAVAAGGPALRFKDNYFELAGRPTFLFGSDTYSNVYSSSCENPWTWHLDHVAARDFGFNVYENLQYCNPPQYKYSDSEWRKFEGMAQLTQKHGLVFMPCQLCGHNVAIDDKLLSSEADECRDYAAHLGQTPGLLYYLNGDFQFRADDKPALTALWNEWLQDKYQGADRLRDSWGDEVYGAWGELPYPPPPPAGWDSVRECDRTRFEVSLTRRWVQRHVQAVRSADPAHPITSEYYQQPYPGMAGIDLPLTIGDQDASNIGYFGPPNTDIDNLPLCLRFNDLRVRGKSLGLGEYGVKTHPGWGPGTGAGGYHPMRTEEEQKQLFMAVAHYGLGMGACKVQNWCLRDASESVFPWGVFYPNGRLPKDIACWHRNLSVVWRHFSPRYVAPTTTVLLPDNLRLGARGQVGVEVAFNCFRALLGLHEQFNVLNEQNIEALSGQTKLLIWPAPFCPDDATVAKVKQWVEAGGRLLVTGDLSRNWDRKRTRTARLKDLCGVEFVRELYAPPARSEEGTETFTFFGQAFAARPCLQVRPAGAETVWATAAGAPLLLRNPVGKGAVTYCTDPLEMGAAERVLPLLRTLYISVLTQRLAVARLQLPSEVHLCLQPLQSGGEFAMAFNTNLPPGSLLASLPAGKGEVQARIAARYPAMTATNGAGDLVAVGCSGEASLAGKPLVEGQAQVIYLSLDGHALPQSQAVLLCPFSSGRTALRPVAMPRDAVMVLGDIVDGQWRTLQTLPYRAALDLDEDTMTCLVLICGKREVARWTAQLTEAMSHPESLKAY